MSNVQATRTNMPVVLLKDGASETKGREAQRNNIAAARIISDIVNTSLGPKGMDKMLVDSLGDVTITNDGATILKEIDVQHPAAKMLVEIAKTTDNEVGVLNQFISSRINGKKQLKSTNRRSYNDIFSMLKDHNKWFSESIPDL